MPRWRRCGTTSPVFSIVLPVVLAVVMFGLGLALTVAYFARVLTVPRLWGLAHVGMLWLLFSVLSLTAGYVIPRLARIGHRQAVAPAMEIGIHNAVLAITVAITVLAQPDRRRGARDVRGSDVPPATLFAWLVARPSRQPRPSIA